jgi:hypothetical protein
MSPTREMTDPEVAELVVRTLAAKARDASVPAQPFDPTRRTGFGRADAGGQRLLGPEPAAVPRRRLRRPPALAAAAAAVLVIAAGVVVAGRDDGRPATRTEREPLAEQPPGRPDDVMLPRWLPDGLVPWSGSWGTFTDPGIPFQRPLQLFKGDGEAGVVLQFWDTGTSQVMGEPVTVRGLPGTVTPGGVVEDAGVGMLQWDEGATVTATFAGMTVEQLVAFLDGLTWKSTDHQAGFAPPEGGDLPLVEETGTGGASSPVRSEFGFGDPAQAPPGMAQGRWLWVQTATGGGRPDFGYYLDWLTHGRRADGVMRAVGGGSAALSWPDGRTVSVTSRGLTDEELQRVLDSVAPATPEDLDALVAAVAHRLEELPVVAQATLPSGTVELRDGGGTDRAVCLRRPGHGSACRGIVSPLGEAPDDGLTSGSVSIDGTWYALAVAPQPVVLTPEDIFHPSDVQLPNETATNGPWQFTLAVPPAELDHVGLRRDGNLVLYLSRPQRDG